MCLNSDDDNDSDNDGDDCGDNSSDALMVGVMTIIVVKVVTACGVAILVSDDCKWSADGAEWCHYGGEEDGGANVMGKVDKRFRGTWGKIFTRGPDVITFSKGHYDITIVKQEKRCF